MSTLRMHEPINLVSTAELAGIEPLQAQMHASPYISLRKIVCERCGDQLVLRGHVESYHMKQLAQETVRGQSHGQTIVNLLTVD